MNVYHKKTRVITQIKREYLTTKTICLNEDISSRNCRVAFLPYNQIKNRFLSFFHYWERMGLQRNAVRAYSFFLRKYK